MPEYQVEVEGLKQLGRDLRKVDRELAKQLQRGHKQVAEKVAEDARGTARTTFGRHASQAKGIKGRGSQSKAAIALNTGRTPRLLAAEFGTKTHNVPRGRTGRTKKVLASSMSRRVFRPWSGNQWNPGEGPGSGVGYAVHPTIRRWVQSGLLADTYADFVLDGFEPAFPE